MLEPHSARPVTLDHIRPFPWPCPRAISLVQRSRCRYFQFCYPAQINCSDKLLATPVPMSSISCIAEIAPGSQRTLAFATEPGCADFTETAGPGVHHKPCSRDSRPAWGPQVQFAGMTLIASGGQELLRYRWLDLIQ